MCATFNIDEDTLKRLLEKYPNRGKPRENGDVFPSDNAIVITAHAPEVCKWGFTRYDGKGLMINARAETVTEKRAFAPSFIDLRCVIPANGFYEWDGEKRKHYFVRTDGKPLFLCGFCRKQSDGMRFIVLTKAATAPISDFHNRIPVLATAEQTDKFLTDTPFARDFITRDTAVKLTATY